MLIKTFLEAPGTGEQPPLPAGDDAHRRINEHLVGQLLDRTRNASAPGGDKMGAEIVKVMWGLCPGTYHSPTSSQSVHRTWTPHGELEDCKTSGHPKPGKPDYTRFELAGSYRSSTASAS